ncbi:alkaline phosphatase family protein [Spirillospora sp. CA-128828]|uniref:alkaline phosphatase family protein n=1 Tax=Spirillospora sp. CA-128828 TaxID=3240033 RepID=UPI003D938918
MRKATVMAGSVVMAGALAALGGGCASGKGVDGTPPPERTVGKPASSRTPIKHVVVIYGENISFDHYFGTYPRAANTDGTPFRAAKRTPRVDGLTRRLLTKNPNRYNPKRLSPSQALTCDQNHGYAAEQKAVNGGRMDKFVESTEHDKCTGQPILFGEPGLVMDYYDGNTVTAMWNYAQNYTMSDKLMGFGVRPVHPRCPRPHLRADSRRLRGRPEDAQEGLGPVGGGLPGR